jgi:hypothetical protein
MFTLPSRTLLLPIGPAIAESLVMRAQDEYDFAISPAFLEQLESGHTILASYRMHVDERSKIKGPGEDCEVHLGGTLLDQEFGDPTGVVAEPPNECRYLPGAAKPTTTPTAAKWRALLDAKVVHKDCTVLGFPRIFTEHAEGGQHSRLGACG